VWSRRNLEVFGPKDARSGSGRNVPGRKAATHIQMSKAKQI
jgi:hypothetical protein